MLDRISRESKRHMLGTLPAVAASDQISSSATTRAPMWSIPGRPQLPVYLEIFEAYPHIGKVLPAVGYSAAQLAALRTTINDADADAVVSATPADLAHLLNLNKQVVRARYEFAEVDEPRLSSIVDAFVEAKTPHQERMLMLCDPNVFGSHAVLTLISVKTIHARPPLRNSA